MGRFLITLLLAATTAAAVQADDKLAKADELFRAGKFAEAKQAYAAVVAKDADNYGATVRLGEIALLSNRLDEAERLLKSASQIKPDEKTPKSLLAEVYYRQDRFAEAAVLRRDIGPEVIADKLAGFAGLVPNRLTGAAAETRIEFVQTDPLPIVKVRINHGEPVHLLIDTGAAELYLDPEYAESCGATLYGSTTGRYAGGMQAPTGHARIDSLQLGDYTLRNVPALLLPTRRMPFGPPGVQVEGVLGTAVLYHFFATLDYPQGQLVLQRKTDEARAKLDKLAAAEKTHVVPLWMAGSHFIVAWGHIDDAPPCLLFVDTGLAGGGLTCQQSMIDEAGIDLSGVPGRMAMGGGGPITIKPFVVDRVSFGDVVREDVQAFAGGMPPEEEYRNGFRMAGVISHGFFRPYALTFDFEKMRLLLTPR